MVVCRQPTDVIDISSPAIRCMCQPDFAFIATSLHDKVPTKISRRSQVKSVITTRIFRRIGTKLQNYQVMGFLRVKSRMLVGGAATHVTQIPKSHRRERFRKAVSIRFATASETSPTQCPQWLYFDVRDTLLMTVITASSSSAAIAFALSSNNCGSAGRAAGPIISSPHREKTERP